MNDSANIYYATLHTSSNLTTPANIKGSIEDENSQCRVLGPAGSNQAIIKMSTYKTIASVFGVTRDMVNTSNTYMGIGGSDASPAYKAYAHIGLQPHNGASLSDDIHFKVDMLFYCVFTNPVKYSQS